MERTKQIKYHVCDFCGKECKSTHNIIYRSSSYIPVLKVMGNGELCQNRWMFVKSAKIKLQEC